jgi:hypothetical protein
MKTKLPPRTDTMPTNAVPPDPRPLNFRQVLVRRWRVELRELDGSQRTFTVTVHATGPEAAVDQALSQSRNYWDYHLDIQPVEIWVALDKSGGPNG